MKKFIVAALFFGAYLSAAVPATERAARRQETVDFWKTVKTALEKEGYKSDSPFLKRSERYLRRAENRLGSLGAFYATRAARPERHHRAKETARHAKKAHHVRGAAKKETVAAKAPTKRPSKVKGKAKKASWWNRAKAEVERVV